jgi:NADH-quinone oxidoreductase subunit F
VSGREPTAETHPLTWRIAGGEPVLDIAAWEALDGYAAVRRALREFEPGALTSLVKDANLRGRGGAGFPTGVKWGLVPMGPDEGSKYLICNADEMEPGTFKDRLLLEREPHLMIESMIASGWAIQATRGYIFVRGEYVLAAQRLNKAIAEARERGYLGANILGTGWDFELYVHTGAGRYICGEETALINALEGRRANPRAKPPFPQIAGAWGRPTIVNNVETLCNVPGIIMHGAAWFTDLARGRSTDGGTKLYGVSGRVKRPGVWELPIGTTAREILEEHGGGMQDGLSLRAWLPGGASTDFLLPEHLDLAMDYDTIVKARSRMGTGLITVVDDRQSIVAVMRNIMEFFSRESCGWCTPCRDGLPWSVRLLSALEHGEGAPEDVEVLESLCGLLGPGKTYCLLAPGAVEPLQSALRFFRADFERGVASRSRATSAAAVAGGAH